MAVHSLFAQHVIWQDRWWAPYATVISIVLLHLFSHASLLDRTWRGLWQRRLLLPLTLYLVLDLGVNTNYSFGSPLRDTAFGTFLWHALLRTLDVGLVYDWEQEAPPRWIVPDWKREAREASLTNGSVDDAPSKSIDSKEDRRQESQATTIHPCRLIMRPEWAQRPGYVPQHWILLDYPTSLCHRLLWTIDVTFMRRVGTSFLWPNQLRAMEWSRSKLELAGRHQRQGGQSTGKGVTQGALQPFGYSDASVRYALLDTAMALCAIYYLSHCHVPGTTFASFYHLTPAYRLWLTICVGTCIALPATLVEKVMLWLAQRGPLALPATALIPTYRDVGRSRSVTELWSWRWHAMSKRDFVRVAKLLPIGRLTRGRLGRAWITLQVFFLSGVVHSFLLTRTQIRLVDPLWPFKLTFSPGSMAFFLSQGVLILFEQMVTPVLPAWLKPDSKRPSGWHAYMVDLLPHLWTWSVLLLTGQWLTADVVANGLMDRQQILSMRPSAFRRDFGPYFARHLYGISPSP